MQEEALPSRDRPSLKKIVFPDTLPSYLARCRLGLPADLGGDFDVYTKVLLQSRLYLGFAGFAFAPAK